MLRFLGSEKGGKKDDDGKKEEKKAQQRTAAKARHFCILEWLAYKVGMMFDSI